MKLCYEDNWYFDLHLSANEVLNATTIVVFQWLRAPSIQLLGDEPDPHNPLRQLPPWLPSIAFFYQPSLR